MVQPVTLLGQAFETNFAMFILAHLSVLSHFRSYTVSTFYGGDMFSVHNHLKENLNLQFMNKMKAPDI